MPIGESLCRFFGLKPKEKSKESKKMSVEAKKIQQQIKEEEKGKREDSKEIALRRLANLKMQDLRTESSGQVSPNQDQEDKQNTLPQNQSA